MVALALVLMFLLLVASLLVLGAAGVRIERLHREIEMLRRNRLYTSFVADIVEHARVSTLVDAAEAYDRVEEESRRRLMGRGYVPGQTPSVPAKWLMARTDRKIK